MGMCEISNLQYNNQKTLFLRASFDLTDPIQQQKCFHYTNLQPLWAEDNYRKKDKIL